MIKKLKQTINIDGTAGLYISSVMLKLLAVAISFVSTIFLNRCLGVALRGNYTTITNYANMAQMLLNLGVGTAYANFKRREAENGLVIYSTLIYLMALCYLVPVIIISVFTKFYWIAILSVICAIENVLIFVAIVEDIKKKNKTNIISNGLHLLCLIFAFFFYRYDLNFVLLLVILDHAVFCLLIIFRYRIFYFNLKLINSNLLLKIGKVAIPAMLMNLLMYLNYHADIVFLDVMRINSFDIGLYGTAVTLGNMVWIIPDAFKDTIFFRSSKKDNPLEILYSMAANIVICLIIIVGFAILGKAFLRYLYGKDFVSAYSLVILMLLGCIPMVLYKLIHPIYISNGNTKVVVYILFASVVSNCIGNVLMIPTLGALGAAISSVISYAICGLVFMQKFWKDYCITSELKKRKQ